MNIAFVGGGNMATALIRGLLERPGLADEIHAVDPNPQARAALDELDGVTTHAAVAPAVARSAVVVLAVKPQVMPAVLGDLAPVIGTGRLVLSVAAGITVATMRAALGPDLAVVRTMPKTPALLGAGIAGLFAGPGCSATDRERAEAILGSVGETVWLDEEGLMDVVTAISGSGPAYFYLLGEALSAAGIQLGLPAEVADRLARHTLSGAGRMAVAGGAELGELRRRVTSPGGTTQAALESLADGGFSDLIAAAVRAATRRGRELSGAER